MREIWDIIPAGYRRGCLRVAALVPVKAILDLVGVAALLPVMMLVLNPAKLHDSFVGDFARWIEFPDDGNLTLFIIAAVILVLLVKTALSLLIINYQNRFLMGLYRNLSSRMFVSLYSRGLLYIKNQNSSRMAFNVIGVCHNFVMGYLGGWMQLLGELAFVTLLLVSLLVYSLNATLTAVIAFIPAILVYVIAVRKPLNNMSRKVNEARREQNKLLYEAFRGYSEVQINDAFPGIRQRFVDGLNDISGYRVRSSMIQSIPSYLLELSVVVVIAIMMLFGIDTADPDNVVFLSILAVSLMKLMPAVRSILGSISALNVTEYTKEVIAEIKTPTVFHVLHDDVSPMPFEHSIEARDVTFAFDENPVIKSRSFIIEKGCRFGIKGRTGAGKTTLFNLLLGLYPPTEGEILIDGVPLSADNVLSWHKIVGYVPQEVFVADSTIIENVALGTELKDIDRKKVEKALQQASLWDFICTLPDGVDTKIGEAGCKLSGGQRQRLGIARALYKDASVLFFDEATSSLDSQTEQEVNMAIQELSDNHKELTIIVISHRDSTLSFCNRIFEL